MQASHPAARIAPRPAHSPREVGCKVVQSSLLPVSAHSSLIDAGNISPWAKSAAAWAIQQGVVSGYELPDGTHRLVPGERIARERVAVVLSNALEKGIL